MATKIQTFMLTGLKLKLELDADKRHWDPHLTVISVSCQLS